MSPSSRSYTKRMKFSWNTEHPPWIKSPLILEDRRVAEYNTVCVRGYSIYPDGQQQQQQQQGQVCAVRCKLGQQYVIHFSLVPLLAVGLKEPPARGFIYNAGSARRAGNPEQFVWFLIHGNGCNRGGKFRSSPAPRCSWKCWPRKFWFPQGYLQNIYHPSMVF